MWSGSSFFNIVPLKIAWLGVEDITENLFYMVMGLYISKDITKNHSQNFKISNGITAVIVAGFIFKMYHSVLYMDKIVCLIMLYAVLNIAAGISRYPLQIINYLGRHAFVIYIYSWPIQVVLELILVVVLKVNWLFCYIVMFAGGLAGPLLIYYMYNRWFPKSKFLNRMIGV